MIYLLLVAAGAAGLFFFKKRETTSGEMLVPTVLRDPESVEHLDQLPDVSPENQGGNWTQAYDAAFMNACSLTGIPFALIKAQAIRESNLKPKAKADEGKGRYSYGLCQVMWWKGSNRLAFAGFPDDRLGDGAILFEPETNALIGARFILDNWSRFGNIRDTTNAYNTGVAESKRIAPNNYVNDVLNNYRKLVGLEPIV